jgi:hypothetical protein
MCCVLLVCLLVFSSFSSAVAGVVLNEVYYDHPGPDGGWEFVELFNNGAEQDLTGWTIEVGDDGSAGWRVVWTGVSGDRVGADSLFLIAGEFVRMADVVVRLGLQNGPDAIRLVAAGIEVDRLGYGELSAANLFEGVSAADAASGFSLGRYPDGLDSDHNSNDFKVLEPSPGWRNRPLRNVALLPVGPRRVALEPGVPVLAVVRVSNDGVDAVSLGAVTVTVADTFGIELSAPAVNPISIASGEFWDASFTIVLTAGYHAIDVEVAYAGDERIGDDRIRLWRRLGAPPVIVSEVLSDPPAGCPEYIEIHNVGTVPRDVAGYRLRDAASDPALVTASSTPLEAGAFCVLTSSASALLEWFPALDAARVVEIDGSWPSLNHSGSGAFADSVVLADDLLLPVDVVAYPPQPSARRGRSLERVDLFPGTRPHSWIVSPDPSGGSPGRANSRGLKAPVLASAIDVTPNPFPVHGGTPLLITVPARADPVRTHVRVFDINGGLVADVGTSTQLPFVFIWDGRNRWGRSVRSGIYLIACENISLDDGSRVVERVVLGCVGKKR